MQLPRLHISRRFKKRLFIALGILASIFIMFWAVVYWYVHTHKQELINKVQNTLSERMGGTFTVEDVSPDFIKTFPNVAVRLDNVSLVDSQYNDHKKKLLDIKHLYVKINLFSIFSSHPKVSKVILNSGKMHLFVDSSGYSNNYLLKSKKEKDTADKKKSSLDVNIIELQDVGMLIENAVLNKRYEFKIKDGITRIKTQDGIMKINADIDAHIGQLGFNLSKGSFLKDTDLKGNLLLAFNTKSKLLEIKQMPLHINGQALQTSGFFDFGKDTIVPFNLKFVGEKLRYTPTMHWLTENIQRKLSAIDMDKPLKVSAIVSGDVLERGTTPNVDVEFETKNNVVRYAGSVFTDVHFTGRYGNEVIDGLGRVDSNSVIRLDTLRAMYDDIPIIGNDITLKNLITPHVVGHLKASFNAKNLNKTVGSEFNFTSGLCAYDLKYNGHLFSNSVLADNIYGSFLLKNIDFTYVSRNMQFKNANADIELTGADMVLKSVNLFYQNSDLNINGISRDFLKSFIEMPGKAMLELHLMSNNLNLNPFESFFVKKRVSKSAAQKGQKLKDTEKRMNDFLTNSSIGISMNIKKVVFKKFAATNIKSNMRFTESGVAINNFSSNHANGVVAFAGNINQQGVNNPFTASVNLQGVSAKELFMEFDDFGFQNFSSQNIEGSISIKGAVSGNITENGKLISKSLNGSLNYNLQNAALKNFPAFEKIKKWFKNRELDNIRIAQFAGDVNVKNGALHLPPTSLQTSAINVQFQGVYDLAGGPTNLDITVPLRNPKIDMEREAKGLGKRKGKGIVINLKATSDANGKVKIGLGKTDELKEKEAHETETQAAAKTEKDKKK